MYFWRKTLQLQTIEKYRRTFNAYLNKQISLKEPEQLYEPMIYIMGLGGKRLRPVLTLMITEALKEDYKKALPAALALELFHNFSLVHDDIMDAAPLRRGKATVHSKWDINTGILSGDAMLIRSYQLFESYTPDLFKPLVELFSKTALEVCEGQQYDVDFENREEVTIAQYLHMIRCKTAVLLAASMQTGAMVAGASALIQQAAYDFGIYLGLAFQLQDDYLDTFGDSASFGKQIGGDIIENKKTFLYLKSLELSGPEERKELEHLFSIRPQDPSAKIKRVREIFEMAGAHLAAKEQISEYTDRAHAKLEEMSLEPKALDALRAYGDQLKHRSI